MTDTMYKLEWMPGTYAVAQLPSDAAIPEWAANAVGFSSITRSDKELSIVACEDQVPDDVEKCDRGWVALRIAEPVDFSQSGILADLITPLAKEEISIFAISTYETDVLLTKGGTTIATRQALSNVADVSDL